jgi:hypothetical protein
MPETKISMLIAANENRFMVASHPSNDPNQWNLQKNTPNEDCVTAFDTAEGRRGSLTGSLKGFWRNGACTNDAVTVENRR